MMGGRGSDEDKVLSDLWQLDVNQRQAKWKQITDISEEGGSPEDRMSHSLA